MKYLSLNHHSKAAHFQDAVKRGLAPDRGLYFPEEIPTLPKRFFENIDRISIPEMAYEVIYPYIGDEIPKTALMKIVTETLNFEFPLVEISDQISALELFQGPTLAFKDVGARFMARTLGYFNKNQRFLCPAIGDYNNDGIDDLLLGTIRGEIVVRINSAKSGEAFDFSEPQFIIEDLDVGSEASPMLYDVNKDGINDLIIGEQSGNLNYYKGLGNSEFELITQNWGQVKTNGTYWSYTRDDQGIIIDSTLSLLTVGGSHPVIADIDGN
ncbi:MAG: hypothetical protein EBS74_07835, partial [Flavobacteriia bacterium]|nr:hypothetical protein [Flavobacteriia bacterium]